MTKVKVKATIEDIGLLLTIPDEVYDKRDDFKTEEFVLDLIKKKFGFINGHLSVNFNVDEHICRDDIIHCKIQKNNQGDWSILIKDDDYDYEAFLTIYYCPYCGKEFNEIIYPPEANAE